MADKTSMPTKTIAYRLFQYREELFRSDKSDLSLTNTKRKLTILLIDNSYLSVKNCTMDLKTIKRQITFKQKLQERIMRLRKIKTSKHDAALKYINNKLRQMNMKEL